MGSSTEPWSVWCTDKLNRDGRSRYLVVCPADGGHVTEDDAEWLRAVILAAQDRGPHQVSLIPIQTIGDTGPDWLIAVCSCGRWSSNKTCMPGQALKSWVEHKKAKEARHG